MQTYLLAIYDIDFNHARALLKYVSLVSQFLLKFFFTPFNMNSQKKHLLHVMLYFFKKYDNDNANNTANEICSVYGNTTTSLRSFAIGLGDLELTILT